MLLQGLKLLSLGFRQQGRFKVSLGSKAALLQRLLPIATSLSQPLAELLPLPLQGLLAPQQLLHILHTAIQRLLCGSQAGFPFLNQPTHGLTFLRDRFFAKQGSTFGQGLFQVGTDLAQLLEQLLRLSGPVLLFATPAILGMLQLQKLVACLFQVLNRRLVPLPLLVPLCKPSRHFLRNRANIATPGKIFLEQAFLPLPNSLVPLQILPKCR